MNRLSEARRAGAAALLCLALACVQGTVARAESLWNMEGLGRPLEGYDLAARGAGWTAIGVADSLQTSSVNPALIAWAKHPTAHFGLTNENRWIRSSASKNSSRSGQVKLTPLRGIVPGPRSLRFALGLRDATDNSYGITLVGNNGRADRYVRTLTGKGGLTELSAAVASALLRGHLAVGLKLGYLFGTLTDEIQDVYSTAGYTGTSTLIRTRAQGGGAFGIGAQVRPIDRVVLGAAYGARTGTYLKARTTTTSGTVLSRGANAAVPPSIGLGGSVAVRPGTRVSVDWSTQDWSRNGFAPGANGFPNLGRSTRIGAGVVFAPVEPDPKQPAYQRALWRGGFTWSRLPARQFDPRTGRVGAAVTEWALTGGVGIPVQIDRGYMDGLFEIGRTGNLGTVGLRETFIRLGIGFTFSKLAGGF